MSHRSIGSGKSNLKDAAIVRNAQVPLSKTSRLKITRELEGNSSEMPQVFKMPLSAASRLSTGYSSKPSSSRGTTSQFVPSELASTAREQLTKKLNFPIDDPIYKGLIPVNVNDSVIHRDCPPLNRRAMHKKYLQKMINKKKDPEPDLNDFLTDIEPLHSLYPKYTIVETTDFSLLYDLPRGNLDRITEIMQSCGTFY